MPAALVAQTPTPATGNGSWLADRQITATISAASPNGFPIGEIHKGTKVTLRYLSGKWKSWWRLATEDPDSEKTERGDLCRVAIALPANGGGPGKVVAIAPADTAKRPFVFVAESDYAGLVLRINSKESSFAGNPGSVQYSVSIQPGIGGSNLPPKRITENPPANNPPVSNAPVSNAPVSKPVTNIPPHIATGDSDNGIIKAHPDALALVQGREGSGSSFVCQQGGQTWLFTNIHVMADIEHPGITRLEGGPIALGAADAAKGSDVMRFALANPPPRPLEAMTDFGANVSIGDEVIVLGNSGGGGVVTSLKGTVLGIGPDRIEVSAEFIPGNSGSPIVHVKSGKVIGVATYLTRRYDEFAKAPAGAGKPASAGAIEVRRFAYRIDTVQQWELVNWAAFREDAEQMRQISQLTGDVFDFLRALENHTAPEFATQALRIPANEWLKTVRDKHLSEADRERATEGFLRQLQALVRNDVAAAEPRVKYSYFRENLENEREIRDELYKAFDDQVKELISPSQRGGL